MTGVSVRSGTSAFVRLTCGFAPGPGPPVWLRPVSLWLVRDHGVTTAPNDRHNRPRAVAVVDTVAHECVSELVVRHLLVAGREDHGRRVPLVATFPVYVYSACMGNVTIYLPDALAQAVKAAGISVSPVCQRALEEEVKRVETLTKGRVRELAARTIEAQADWRAYKAQEYPEDPRNEAAARTLRALASHVRALDPTDPRLDRLEQFDFDTDFLTFGPEASTALSRVGLFPLEDFDLDGTLTWIIEMAEEELAREEALNGALHVAPGYAGFVRAECRRNDHKRCKPGAHGCVCECHGGSAPAPGLL